ncbi:hypothetical protein AB0K09_03435 [Streptomyces sp. NPDC049577]|uniref:hypothetical protein n=1 Tax=Streptomyces sp. NPDC049577 TaxID=3155153 RepID=UPI0034289929
MSASRPEGRRKLVELVLPYWWTPTYARPGPSARAFSAEQRERLLDLVAQQTPVPTAAKEVGVSTTQVYGRATWDAAFAEALGEAVWSLCVLGEHDPRCGTAAGYRGNSSGRSPRPSCRGTGCREWRRGAAQQERADGRESDLLSLR